MYVEYTHLEVLHLHHRSLFRLQNIVANYRAACILRWSYGCSCVCAMGWAVWTAQFEVVNCNYPLRLKEVCDNSTVIYKEFELLTSRPVMERKDKLCIVNMLYPAGFGLFAPEGLFTQALQH